jgi:hypothetical protein
MPPELQPQAQKAIAEIKKKMLEMVDRPKRKRKVKIRRC